MDRQAIDVHGRIPFSNAERNCALPKMGSKAPTAEGSVVAHSGQWQPVRERPSETLVSASRIPRQT